jgi:hypothetical protein
MNTQDAAARQNLRPPLEELGWAGLGDRQARRGSGPEWVGRRRLTRRATTPPITAAAITRPMISPRVDEWAGSARLSTVQVKPPWSLALAVKVMTAFQYVEARPWRSAHMIPTL